MLFPRVELRIVLEQRKFRRKNNLVVVVVELPSLHLITSHFLFGLVEWSNAIEISEKVPPNLHVDRLE